MLDYYIDYNTLCIIQLIITKVSGGLFVVSRVWSRSGIHYSCCIFILLTVPISAAILIVLALFQNYNSLQPGIFQFLININISSVYYQLFCKTPGQVNTSTDPELHHLNLFLEGAWQTNSLVVVIIMSHSILWVCVDCAHYNGHYDREQCWICLVFWC